MNKITFFKITMTFLLLFTAIAHKPTPAYALTFLLPHELEQQGNVYIHYPSNQRYVYTNNPVFISQRQPIQDGNEEDEYLKAKEQKAKKASITTLPLRQIISQSPAIEVSAKASVSKTEIKKESKTASVIPFDFDSSVIKQPEMQKLQSILPDLKQAEEILLKGYTDKIGAEEYNDKLALRRAEAVKGYLKAQGINDSKIKIDAKGKCCYVSDEDSKNRRVEIWIEVETGKISFQPGSRQ